MKRFSLCFAVLFVLFSFQGGFSRPTQSQLDSLEVLIPAIDSFPSYIRYDSTEVYGDTVVTESTHVGATDYWIGQRFTPVQSSFTLQGVHLQVANPLINYKDSCQILVLTDSLEIVGQDTLHHPNDTLHQDIIIAPLPNRLFSFIFDSTLQFGPGVSFWIILGPVPGGPDNDLVGQGWWALSDCRQCSSKTSDRSVINLSGDIYDWVQYSRGFWILRAGGVYEEPPPPVINEVLFAADPASGDFTRNHEWIELYNPGPVINAQNWQLHKGNQQNPYPLPNFQFNSGAYMVVHFVSGTLPSHDLDLSDLRGDIYINASNVFDDMNDACALNLPPGAPVELVDIVAWNLKRLSADSDSVETTLEGTTAFNDLNKIGRIQPVGGIGPLLTANKGISIGRDDSSSNHTSSPNGGNFHFVGGKKAAGPTMGRKNTLPMVIDVLPIDSTPASPANWTLMLYIAATNGIGADAQERWCYNLLNQIERKMPTTPENINVAVWFDSRNAYPDNDSSNQGTVFRGVLQYDATDTVKNLLPMGKLNSGDPASLQEFVRWAKTRFPASRFALALKGDGAGWQGLCGDADSFDRLEMNELKSALAGGLGTDTLLDLLIFDAPFMSQLEVATQVKPYARFMVASPEMIGPADFDYSRLVNVMKGGNLISVPSGDFVRDTVVNNILDNMRPARDNYWFWVGINLGNLDTLITAVNTLAVNLKNGVGDACGTGTNFQLYLRGQLIKSEQYGGQAQGMGDFIDLKDFCARLTGPPCGGSQYINGAFNIVELLPSLGAESFLGTIVEAQSLRQETPGKHYGLPTGLSIYFPSSRQRLVPIDAAKKQPSKIFNPANDHPFNSPGLAVEGGAFERLRMYARDTMVCYPHASGTCAGDTTMAWYYPLPVVRDFTFVNNTQWDEFLIRYYKPVADAGALLIPGDLNVPLNLNASGSSDADDEPASLKYFWDLNSLANSPLDCDSPEEEDLDKDCVDDATDDADTATTQQIIQYSFQNSGQQKIWLHVWDDYDGTLSGTGRGYHTAKDSQIVDIDFQGVHLVYETPQNSPTYHVYNNALQWIGVNNTCRTDLPQDLDRNGILISRLSSQASSCPTVIWTTAKESTVTFPTSCQNTLDSALKTDKMSVWVCAPLVGKDTVAAKYFKSKLLSQHDSVSISSAGSPANFIVPASGQHFLSGVGTLELNTTSGIPLLQSLSKDPAETDTTICPTFPILVADNGDTVAVARVFEPQKHAIVYSTFGLEQLADSADIDRLLRGVLGWLASPEGGNRCPCAAGKGDLNISGTYSPADVNCILNCVFQGAADPPCLCDPCVADVNCDGTLSPSDVNLEILRVFNGQPLPCQ